MEIKGDDLLFLFGAGASVDAGIPMSNAMVENSLIFAPFRPL